MILEVRHLRMVEAIRREGSVTKAAQSLNLTQPSVSHTLRELENRLGLTLFRRSRKKMVPTEEGERLLQSSSLVLAELGRAERDLLQFRDGVRGSVRITTQCYTCYNWLPPLLRRFQEQHPQLSVEVVPDAKMDPVKALVAYELDLAILYIDPAMGGITTHPLFVDELVAIVSPTHPLCTQKHVVATDFVDQHFISQGPRAESTFYREVLAPAMVEPRQWSVIPLTEAVIQTVASGLGVSVLPSWMVAPEVRAGRLCAIKVTSSHLKRTWLAAAREGTMQSPAVADLVAILKSEAYDIACQVRP